MVKNFYNTVRRFKAFTLLNVIGLTTAFLVLMVVLMQVEVEHKRDKSYPDSERIYLMQYASNFEKGKWSAMLPGIVYEALPSIVPEAEARAIRRFSTAIFGGERYKFDSPAGENIAFHNTLSQISRSFIDMFDMQIVDGSVGVEGETWVMIPESLAKIYFPNSSAVGQTIRLVDDNTKSFIVSAVYRDFPYTSTFPNEIYCSINRDGFANRGNYNYRIYAKLPSSASVSDVESRLNSYLKEQNIGDVGRLKSVEEVYFLMDMTSLDSDIAPGNGSDKLMVFMLVAFLVIVVAGINYLNFTTALVPIRITDINTRKIYGATNFAIRMQHTTRNEIGCQTH